MIEILPFPKSYYRLVLVNFHFMLKCNQIYSFCIKLECEIILWNKNVDLSRENYTLCLKIVLYNQFSFSEKCIAFHPSPLLGIQRFYTKIIALDWSDNIF